MADDHQCRHPRQRGQQSFDHVEQCLLHTTGLIADNAGKWLPFQQGIRMAVNAETGPEVFSRLYSGLYFGGFVAVLVAIGWLLVERRDA